MLPARYLRLDPAGDHAAPAYLAARDEPWARVVIDEMDGFAGRTVAAMEKELPVRLAGLLPPRTAPERAVAGMRHVLLRRWSSRMTAPVPPRRLRERVFEHAAASGDGRDEVLAAVGRDLGLEPAALAAALFADRPGARVLVPPAVPLAPSTAVFLYNLALLQGLLGRAEAVRVHVRAHVRSVVRIAKLRRLVCTYELDGEGTSVQLSGPLSLFRLTTKYGHALASFFPAVVATPGWRLEARCVIGERSVRVCAAAGDPVAAPFALPMDADSALERRLARDFRRLGSAWTLVREAAAIPLAGGKVFFPDFTLRRGDERVLVELVGFYTADYLRSKLEALRQVRGQRVIVLVDESLACDEADIEAAVVVRFRRTIDASALLSAAERVVGGPRTVAAPA